jgi:predicted CopG family antitoxin
MGRINKSISIDSDIAKKGEDQAKQEHRSFSSFIEHLIADYIKSIEKSTTESKK